MSAKYYFPSPNIVVVGRTVGSRAPNNESLFLPLKLKDFLIFKVSLFYLIANRFIFLIKLLCSLVHLFEKRG